jgi:hypothetical protein
MTAMAFAGFVLQLLDFPAKLAGVLLDATGQFILLASEELQFVIRELGDFLFQFALGNVPSSFGCKRAHINVWSWLVCPAKLANFPCKYRAGRPAVKYFQKTKQLRGLEFFLKVEC